MTTIHLECQKLLKNRKCPNFLMFLQGVVTNLSFNYIMRVRLLRDVNWREAYAIFHIASYLAMADPGIPGGVNSQGRCGNLLFAQFLPKIAWKLKIFRRWHASLAPLSIRHWFRFFSTNFWLIIKLLPWSIPKFQSYSLYACRRFFLPKTRVIEVLLLLFRIVVFVYNTNLTFLYKIGIEVS